MGWLVKIGFSHHTLAVRPDHISWLKVVRPPCHDGPYVRSRYRISALRVFKENLIFSPLFAYSPTPKANKGFLGPLNTDYNLYAKQQC